MARAEATVEELVGMIERGELRLPEMQRRYVWRATRVRDLLDSLYRGYPSGAILLWDSTGDVPLQDMAISQGVNPFHTTRLLLDGQQRLTSLSAVVRGVPVRVRGRQKPVQILFNLNHPEGLAVVTEVEEDADDDEELRNSDEEDSTEDELQQRFDRMTFVVATKKLEQMPGWVRVTDVFNSASDAPFLKASGVTDFNDPKYVLYSERLARLRGVRKYVYRMDVLPRELSYDEVTEIFVRVNSLGAKLRSSDLALAQITAKWRTSLRVFEAFAESCASDGFDVGLGLHLKNLVVFASGQSRFRAVGGMSLATLEEGWRLCKDGMDFAINFLKSNASIDNPALLSSPFVLVTLGYFGHHNSYSLGDAESARLRYWVLVANAKGRYSRGSSETLLDQDLATIRSNGGVDGLLHNLTRQVGRLDITSEELAGRNQRSALFKTMFLAFRAAGATDWRSKVGISLRHRGAQHRLQFHHIFPKAVLRGVYPTREIDDIANLCFLGGKMNRLISDKPPKQYLAPVMAGAGKQVFDAQCIPTDAKFLDVEDYHAFLTERRRRVAERLNEFLQE